MTLILYTFLCTHTRSANVSTVDVPNIDMVVSGLYDFAFFYVAVQVASKSLMDTLNEMYESQWVGHDHMCTDSNNLDMLWSDYTHKLADQVLIPLNTYQAQFAETRVSAQTIFQMPCTCTAATNARNTQSLVARIPLPNPTGS